MKRNRRFFISDCAWLHKDCVTGNMYLMTQAQEKGEEPCLPHGLCIANTYTEMTTGSKPVAVVIKNQMAAPITISKGIKITWGVSANRVPPVEVMPGSWTECREFDGPR